MERIRCKAYFKCDYDLDYDLKGQLLPVTGLHFYSGLELSSVSVDSEYGEIQDLRLEADKIVVLQEINQRDKNNERLYEMDIVKYEWCGILSYGIIKPINEYIEGYAGWNIDRWCGLAPYGYESESMPWKCFERVGNYYTHLDFLESIKYGVTNNNKPRTRKQVKSIIVTALKKVSGYYSNPKSRSQGFIPSQVQISESGIANTELGNELRDELVKEDKLIQYPKRPWMVKIKD